MNISITFRQMDSTDAVKGYAKEKLAKLQKFLRHPMKASCTLSTQHRAHSTEVDLSSGGEHFHAHETSEDMYAAIDKVCDKLEAQIRAAHDGKKKKGADRASDHLVGDLLGPDPGDSE